jgi:hypothetical protein
MSVGTHGSKRTVAFPEGLANGDIGGEAEAKGLSEEWTEGESREAGIAGSVRRHNPVRDALNVCHGGGGEEQTQNLAAKDIHGSKICYSSIFIFMALKSLIRSSAY